MPVYLKAGLICAITQGPALVGFAIAILKFFIIFQEGAPYFHFGLGPANYIVVLPTTFYLIT